MRIKELVALLEHYSKISSHDAARDAAQLAEDLRDLCGDLALRGHASGMVPGQIGVEHALKLGIEATIDAHAEIERARSGS